MYLSLALSPRRTLNGRLCVWACGRCGEAAAHAPPVAAAARAAAAQALRAYCAQLGTCFTCSKYNKMCHNTFLKMSGYLFHAFYALAT